MMKFKRLFISIGSALTAMSLGTLTAYASTVTVQPGQTMWTISQSQGVSLASLEAANPSVNPADLITGSTLQMPTQQTSTYTVQSGDTLWKIGHRFNVAASSIQAANPNVTASNLLVGTQLTIPATASSTTNGSSNSTMSVASANTAASTTTSSNSTVASSSGSVAAQNLYWMEHVIHAEAGGESLSAQIAVGDVIMHRLNAGIYGSNVHDVVFQIINGHYQFTSVANGYIYSTPNASSIQAAQDVLQKQQDVVPGALVFYNPSQTPSGSWVWSQPVIGQFGHLVFAK